MQLPESESTDFRDRPLLRYLAVTALAISYIVTWPLWQVRSALSQLPPNLPEFDFLPQLDVGPLMLATLAIVLWRPWLGITIHTVALLAAIGLDQMRIQPEFISLVILLWGSLASRTGVLLCRTHLIAMWFYAGLHKLLSADYLAGRGQQMWQALVPSLPDSAAMVGAISVAVIEIVLAVLVVIRRTRRVAAWMACGLHLCILLGLVSRNWNHAVWAWNVAIALGAPLVLLGWREGFVSSVLQRPRWARAAVAVLLLSPLAFYVGRLDAYLAHCLYSSNTPVATLEGHKHSLNRETMDQLGVPFPPAHRLYEQYFAITAEPDALLHIRDPRPWAKWRALHDRTLARGGEYRSGQKFGHWKQWHKGGGLSDEGGYLEGEMHGPWTHWSADGRIEGRGEYVKGEMQGNWEILKNDGSSVQITYRNGEKIGP
jgi:uncharacterized membrane protein YphA (DoxX/SURF4 family)